MFEHVEDLKEALHDAATHDELRESPAWKDLALVGEQGDGDDRLELRNCTCGTTLAKRIDGRGAQP